MVKKEFINMLFLYFKASEKTLFEITKNTHPKNVTSAGRRNFTTYLK